MQTTPRAAAVRDFQPEDATDILRIAAANGLEDFSWPEGAYPAVALVDGRITAFCAVRELPRENPKGLVIDELWSQGDRDGIRGLAALAEFCEDKAAERGRELGRDLYLGGVVADYLTRHAAALEARGFTPFARVYRKLVPRHV